MKKRTLLYLSAIILIGGGGFIVNNIPSLKRLFWKDDIAPYKEWPRIIIGSWLYKHIYKEKNDIFTITGKITFSENYTFNLYSSADLVAGYNYYMHSNAGGGAVYGKWKYFDNGKIQLYPDSCNIANPSYQRNGNFNCDYFNNFIYGNCITNSKDTKVATFNKNKIIVTGFDFRGGVITYQLSKAD